MMFRFEFFVEDRHLVPVMYAVAGRAFDLKVLPVANATVANNKMVATSSGVMWRDFVEYLRANNVRTGISAEDGRRFLNSIHAAGSHAGSLIKSGVKAGVLVRENPGSKKFARYKLKG